MKLDNRLLEELFILFLVVLFVYYLYLASKTAFLGEDESAYYYDGQLFSQLKYPTFLDIVNPNVLPAFVPLFYASLFSVFGSSLALAKMISTLFGFLTLVVIYLMGKKINLYVGIFASGILFSMTLFTNFMLIAYVDIPIAFFSILFTYVFLKMDSVKKAVLAGVMLSLAFYVKDSGFFLLLAMILYALMIYVNERNIKYLKLSLIAAVTSIILFVPFVIRNIYYYNYPYTLAFDVFFPNTSSSTISTSFLTQLSTIFDFAGAFGWVGLIFIILGSTYIALSSDRFKHKEAFFSFFILLSFIAIYTVGYLSKIVTLTDARYLMILFPQLSMIGGYFMWVLKEKNKYFLLVLIPIFLFGIYSSVLTANYTSSSTRFPSNYIDALKWIGTKTPKDSIIFTAYGGSVRYFADRYIIWSSIKEFPTLMTTQNSTYVYDVLKKNNVSYILIWNGIISQDYIIPGSNIAGVFTYNFLNVVNSDNKHFNATYQNADDIIFKLL